MWGGVLKYLCRQANLSSVVVVVVRSVVVVVVIGSVVAAVDVAESLAKLTHFGSNKAERKYLQVVTVVGDTSLSMSGADDLSTTLKTKN